MSLLDSLFGAGASAAIMGNSQLDNNELQRQQALQAQYSSYQQRRFVSHTWVFNGQPCSLHEFADAIWGTEEHPDKMLFILTHAGPKSK